MTSSTKGGTQLGALAGLAGGSLSTAQGQLGQGVDLSSAMVMSEAALEIKAAIGRSASGELLVEPLSSAHLAGQLNAAAISTVRLNFIATASEVPATPPPAAGNTGTTPSRFTRDQALAVFTAQDDVQRLEKLIGPFELRTQFVSGSGQWIVQAVDPAGRLVREQIIRQTG